jgi:hypothetical protein
LYCGVSVVLWSVSCTVECQLYCGVLVVLWSVSCTVECQLYCGVSVVLLLNNRMITSRRLQWAKFVACVKEVSSAFFLLKSKYFITLSPEFFGPHWYIIIIIIIIIIMFINCNWFNIQRQWHIKFSFENLNDLEDLSVCSRITLTAQ